MKRLVYLVLKQTPNAFGILESVRGKGYNGTIMSTESLRHLVEDPLEERSFINLRHLEQFQTQESLMCLFIVEENRLSDLKATIRTATDGFKAIKGFMFSRPIEDYEGSV